MSEAGLLPAGRGAAQTSPHDGRNAHRSSRSALFWCRPREPRHEDEQQRDAGIVSRELIEPLFFELDLPALARCRGEGHFRRRPAAEVSLL